MNKKEKITRIKVVDLGGKSEDQKIVLKPLMMSEMQKLHDVF